MAFTKCNVAANIIGLITRRSENDNIPQPLDQLTNSPFIGQQVGNCKSFTLTHCLADLFATHHDSRSIPLHTQHHIQLTSLSFQVSQPSHSWVTAISIFLPWKSSQGHGCGQSFIDSHPFRSMSISHPIPFLRYDFFKIWPWKSKVKVMEEVSVEIHYMGSTFYRLTSLSFHVNRPSHSWDTAFSKFWPWKSKVKVMGEVDIKSHNMGPTFYRLTSLSFHVNRLSHSWDTAFSKFDLENPRSRSWGGERWKSQSGCNILSTHMPFVPCQSALPFLRYSIFKIWLWKSKVKVKWPWCCTTTGLDNSIEPQME